MKKILVINGSNSINGNTQYFIESLLKRIDMAEVKTIYPQEFNHCSLETQAVYDISFDKKVNDPEIYELQNEILSCDLLIMASPVYMHNISANLKFLLEKLSTWSHIMRLAGKPTIVLSTCDSNGSNTVISYLCEIITSMGGNVVANCNASSYQLNDSKWLESVEHQIFEIIMNSLNQTKVFSNSNIEKNFNTFKKVMEYRVSNNIKINKFYDEEKSFWVRTGMLECDSYQEYLDKVFNQ